MTRECFREEDTGEVEFERLKGRWGLVEEKENAVLASIFFPFVGRIYG